MGRSKDHSSKDKRVQVERGGSSRHGSALPAPDAGALVPVPASPQNPFPFNARMRLTSSMKEREDRLKNFKVLNPIYPDLGLLSNLDVLDDVAKYFVDNGFGFVFAADPPLVYEALVREFIYSFTPEWRVVKRQRSEFSIPEKHVVEWKFRLGGVEHTYSRDDLLRAFDLADRVTYPYVRKSVGDDFWKLITSGTDNYMSSQSSTKIILPVWRLVHRFLASCVIMRFDEGRWVNRMDLELLCCFHERLRFDALIPITKSLEESTLPTFRGKYIGGGPFVTMLALDLGFSLDPNYALPRKILGEEEMIRRGFLKLERNRHGIHRRLVGRDVFPTPHPPSAPSRPSPPPPQYEVGSSSGTQPKVTMEDLSAQIRALTTYTHEGFLWVGDVFTDLYTRMGYEDFPPPPPHPSDITHSEGAEDSAEEQGEDSDEEAEDTEGGDDMDEDSDASASV